MNVKNAYNTWSKIYDTNENKTRDLEGIALKEILSKKRFGKCLEVGCGTGKNTIWLAQKSNALLALDFSEGMLKIAKQKVNSSKVKFLKKDITEHWNLQENNFDVVVFSLVLEHIKNLEHIFTEISKYISKKGFIYIGELHPFKQYMGSKARYMNENNEEEILDCFVHHLSDFTSLAKKYDYQILNIGEYFDEGDRTNIPRILSILLQKK